MPVKGGAKIKANFKRIVGNITGPLTEKVMTEVLIIGEGYAMEHTPVDLGTLINSQYRVLESTPTGYHGEVGYKAEYAPYVHESKGTLAGLPRTGPNSVGNYWDPNGEPQWLKRAFEVHGLNEIKARIKNGYTIK